MKEQDSKTVILEAAGPIFAKLGYFRTTIRDICTAADVNVAAVNYHFGGKQRLYTELFRYGNERAPYDVTGVMDSDSSPEALLRMFNEAQLRRLLDRGPYAWFPKLVFRELQEPTHVLDNWVNEHIRPRAEFLHGVMAALLGPSATESDIHFCARSVVAQNLLYGQTQAIIHRLYDNIEFEDDAFDALVDHVTTFSLGGIQSVRDALAPPEKNK